MDFNSSMVQLKAEKDGNRTTVKPISIPLWYN